MKKKIRVIAGALGGRLLEVPEEGTRPFAERVRQALFAIVEPRLSDARVLDLCAGSGASGLEALSRGARHALFVERSRRAADVIRRNVVALGMEGRSEIRVGDALAILRALAAAETTFDLVIADPPYDEDSLRENILELVGAAPSPLAPDGLLVISGRRRKGEAAHRPQRGLRLVRPLTYGETAIDLYEHGGEEGLR